MDPADAGSPTPSVPSRRRGRRRWLVGAAAAGLATAAAVAWFEPHKLFIDDRVDEPAPVLATGPASTVATSPSLDGQAAPTSAPPDVDVAGGSFVALDHRTSGAVRILAVDGARSLVRLEDFETENGPDLYVYLSANPADGSEGAFDDDYVSLGRLKGNQGNQNYDVPPDVDVRRYRSVVIWCDRFDSAFGAADLSSA